MKIVSLAPFLTQILCHFGLGPSLAGVTSACVLPEELQGLERVTFGPGEDKCIGQTSHSQLDGLLGDVSVDYQKLVSLAPDLVLARIPGLKESPSALEKARVELHKLLGESSRLLAYDPRTLEQVFQTYEQVGRSCGAPEKGLALTHRVRAQVMNWADNFYDRMKNKRVVVFTSLEPITIGGLWIPDMIQTASGVSLTLPGEDERKLDWNELSRFRPDVIVVAPRNLDLKECLKRFRFFDSFPEWEKLPAVKRGEVFFADGSRYFNTPGPLMLESMGVLISAIAGFESGYITERDIFYRLRWLELHRHRLEQ